MVRKMEVNILNYEKTVLEFEITDGDPILQEFIVNRLSENEGVDFASYKVEHPLIAKQKVIVKTKNKDALELTLAVLEELKNDILEFKKTLKKSK